MCKNQESVGSWVSLLYSHTFPPNKFKVSSSFDTKPRGAPSNQVAAALRGKHSNPSCVPSETKNATSTFFNSLPSLLTLSPHVLPDMLLIPILTFDITPLLGFWQHSDLRTCPLVPKKHLSALVAHLSSCSNPATLTMLTTLNTHPHPMSLLLTEVQL